MSVVVSCFESREPKPWELDTLKQIVITSDMDWVSFSESVTSSEIQNPIHISILTTHAIHSPLVPSVYGSTLMPELLDDHEFSERVNACVRVSSSFLPRGGELATARVVRRTRDGDGLPTGCRNSNPILDTRQYKVKVPDGSVDTYTSKVIAENLATMIDPKGQLGWELCVQWADDTSSWPPPS